MTEQSSLRVERLTHYSHGAGCACKLDPSRLARVVRGLVPSNRAELLVGPQTGDDAAVWKLDDDRALVVTADFITPVVDDARDWGRVAAANAVSDVYAMGGRPLLALNLVCWNDELPDELLAEVLAGAQEIASEGGFVVAGGHTVTDPEPKFGLAVVGEVAPDRLLTNAGLRPDDVLILTKPLGVGVITTAIKRGIASGEAIDAAVQSMTFLNGRASRVALDNGATGATDVTGFGLLGHLGRMARESSVDVTIDVAHVPLIDGARSLAESGAISGGAMRNVNWVDEQLDRGTVDELTVTLLADPQTSGGLVFGLSEAHVDAALEALASSGHRAARIGRARRGTGRLLLR
jgi:selenide, water dikinase